MKISNEINLEKSFREFLGNVLPYLIFPEAQFRNKIASGVVSVYRAKSGRNEESFQLHIEKVENLISDFNCCDGRTHSNINRFFEDEKPLAKRVLMVEEKISSLNRKVLNLEKILKKKKISKKTLPTIKDESKDEKTKGETEKEGSILPDCPRCKTNEWVSFIKKILGRTCLRTKGGCKTRFAEGDKCPKCNKTETLGDYKSNRYECKKCEKHFTKQKK